MVPELIAPELISAVWQLLGLFIVVAALTGAAPILLGSIYFLLREYID